MQDFGQNIVFGEIFMKKFLSVVACLMLAFTCFAFVGCGNKGKEIETKMPESYKIVTTSNSHTTDGDYTTTTTYIKGYYQNHAVVYMYEVNTGIYDYDKSYLWKITLFLFSTDYCCILSLKACSRVAVSCEQEDSEETYSSDNSYSVRNCEAGCAFCTEVETLWSVHQVCD